MKGQSIKEFIKVQKSKISGQSMNVIQNIIFVFLIQGGSMIMGLFTMPAYLRYFDDNLVLGCWYTLLSVINWVLIFDLGIGNGLRNQLTAALAVRDYDKAKKLISSAYSTIAIFILIVTAIVWLILPSFDLNSFFNVSTDVISSQTLLLCVRIIFVGIALRFILQMISSILYAMQKSALVNFMAFITNLSILLYVMIAPTGSAEENLVRLSYVHVIAANLPFIVVTIWVFGKYLKECRPRIRFFQKTYAQSIFKVGIAFFVLQIAYMIVSATNEILISKFTSPQYVTEYQAYYKIFSIISSLFLLGLTPIWSSVTKAQAEGNYTWIKKTYKLLCGFSLLVCAGQMLLIPMLQFLLDIWLGAGQIVVSYKIAFVFALTNCVLIWHNFNSTMANGLGYLKPQFIYLTLAAVVKVPFSYMLVRIFDNWSMIVLATGIVLIPLSIFQPVMLIRYISAKSRESKEVMDK